MKILPIFALSLAFALSAGSAFAAENVSIDNKSTVTSTDQNLLTVDRPGFEGKKQYTEKTSDGFCLSVKEYWEKGPVVKGHQIWLKRIDKKSVSACDSNS